MMAAGLFLVFLAVVIRIAISDTYRYKEPPDWIIAPFIALVVGVALIVASLVVFAWKNLP